MNQNYLSALNVVKDIVLIDLIPPLEQLNDTLDPALQTSLNSINEKLDYIKNFLDNIRPNYWGLFTCEQGLSVTASGQIIPFNRIWAGTLTANADGTINIPANSTFLLECDFNCNFSVTDRAYFSIYNADTGTVHRTVVSMSENYNSATDYVDIAVAQITTGSTPIRLGVKVHTKQVSGTCTLNEYNSFIKLVEV